MFTNRKLENVVIKETPSGVVLKGQSCLPREHNFCVVMQRFDGHNVVVCTKCGGWTEPSPVE